MIDYRQKAREMAVDVIETRIVELHAAAIREPRRAYQWEQQARILRDELQRRAEGMKQLQQQAGIGPRKGNA